MKDLATKVWYWLSVQTSESYLGLVKTKAAYFFILSLALLYLIYLIYLMYLQLGFSSYARRTSHQLVVISIVASIFGLVPLFLYGYRFYVWCISGTKPFKLFRDLSGLSLFLAIPLVLLFVVAELLSQSEATILELIGKALLLFTVALSSFVTPLIVILQPTIWLMLLLSILMLLFRTLELIAVRIAESEKGPALAISALLTAAGVALKSFNG